MMVIPEAYHSHLSLHGLSPNIVDQYILFVVWLYDLSTEIANIENS
jgi:hypothetical protein